MIPSSSEGPPAVGSDVVRRIVREVLAEVSPNGFFSPEELTRRWNIDRDTLNKLGLPWVWIAEPGTKGQIRRLPVSYVLVYERQQQFRRTT